MKNPRITRRRFLKGTASLAATGIARVRFLSQVGVSSLFPTTWQLSRILASLTGTLTGPNTPIKHYPPAGTLKYPRDWAHPLYKDVAGFELELQGVPDGWKLSYKWAMVGNPGEHRYRLRTLTPGPPGSPLRTEVFEIDEDANSVWLPFFSRQEMDLDRVRYKLTQFYVECVVRAEEPGVFGSKEEISLTLPVELDVNPYSISDLPYAEKLREVFFRSAPFWPTTIADQAVTFFTDPEAVGMMVGITVGFIALALIPHPLPKLIGAALSAVLIAKFGIDTVEQFGKALLNLDDNTYGAESESELDVAGKRFAEDCGEPVFNLLLAMVFWKVSEKVSNEVHEYKTARLNVIETIKQDLAKFGSATSKMPAEVVNIINNAKFLVRRMRLSEKLKVTTGLGKQFLKGYENAKAFSIDEPNVFKREHLKDPKNYRIIHKIEITEALRELLLLAINNAERIPEGLKHLPRFKYENGRWNILLPKQIWTEVVVMYTVVDVTILPVEAQEEEQDEETFTLEQN